MVTWFNWSRSRRRAEGRRVVEIDRLTLAAHAEEGLRHDPALDEPGVGEFFPRRTQVDFIAWTVADLRELGGQVDVEPGRRQAPADAVPVVRRPLARIRLKPHELLVDRTAEPRASHVHPQVDLRRQCRREILLGLPVGRVVEDVLVDADIRDGDRGIHPERPDPHTDLRRVRSADSRPAHAPPPGRRAR